MKRVLAAIVLGTFFALCLPGSAFALWILISRLLAMPLEQVVLALGLAAGLIAGLLSLVALLVWSAETLSKTRP